MRLGIKIDKKCKIEQARRRLPHPRAVDPEKFFLSQTETNWLLNDYRKMIKTVLSLALIKN
jgi:hypothetical protein